MFSGLEVANVRHGRRWTATASFVLQGIVVSAAFVLPLIYPTNLPDSLLRHSLLTPISFGEIGVKVQQQRAAHNPPARTPIIVAAPAVIFHKGGPQQSEATISDPIGSTNIGPQGPGSPIGPSNIFSPVNVQPVLKPQPAQPKPVSVMMEGNLIHRVDPQYPAIARQIRLQGTVVLQAFVSAEGRIERPTVVSGPGVLARAAMDAVKQWQYRPYYLNGTPIEVETEITVKFVLNQ
jgi:protein TonB